MRYDYSDIFTLISDLFYNGNMENNYQYFCCEVTTFIVLALIVILPFYVVYKFIREYIL